jgi:hypothetical protein
LSQGYKFVEGEPQEEVQRVEAAEDAQLQMLSSFTFINDTAAITPNCPEQL